VLDDKWSDGDSDGGTGSRGDRVRAPRDESATVVSATGAREPASVVLEYEVTRKGEGDGVVLHGRTSVDGRHEAFVEHSARDREQLQLRGARAERRLVRRRDEVPREHPRRTTIRWKPVLRVARGGTVNADVAGGGWSREVRVKVE